MGSGPRHVLQLRRSRLRLYSRHFWHWSVWTPTAVPIRFVQPPCTSTHSAVRNHTMRRMRHSP
ncbi:hypothetical protein PMIN01_02810 [Paraphaeosphaeria minitans]|uniref:Uncharacterized protein n=1 Tax=Paraphaeosphaeria minitans TaxID=565426 RepID=A0A9P6GS73_9PLEO|nr:hypothetical protein PMIN01_02810 [Paraphaeosphaeria minitans]